MASTDDTGTAGALSRAAGAASGAATAVVVLALRVGEAPSAAGVAGGVVAFLAVWGTLLPLQRHTLRPLRQPPRFPSPPETPRR